MTSFMNGSLPVQVLDGLLLVQVIERRKVPCGHMGLITRAQLTFGTFGPPGATHGWNGQGKLAYRNDLLRLSTTSTVVFVSFTSG